MRILANSILCILSVAYSAALFAAPVTFDVTPTFAAPSGIVDGYRAYRDCDLAAQTSATLIGPASSGAVFSFQGDSAASYVVCVRAYNATGEGGFATVGNITATLAPPGSTSTTYTCELNPASGGTCTVAP
jgi:hypothetical protein